MKTWHRGTLIGAMWLLAAASYSLLWSVGGWKLAVGVFVTHWAGNLDHGLNRTRRCP